MKRLAATIILLTIAAVPLSHLLMANHPGGHRPAHRTLVCHRTGAGGVVILVDTNANSAECRPQQLGSPGTQNHACHGDMPAGPGCSLGNFCAPSTGECLEPL